MGARTSTPLTRQAAPGPAFALPVAFAVACDAFDSLANEPGAMACSRLVSCHLDAPGAGRRQPLGHTKRRRDGGKATPLLRLGCSLLLPEKSTALQLSDDGLRASVGGSRQPEAKRPGPSVSVACGTRMACTGVTLRVLLLTASHSLRLTLDRQRSEAGRMLRVLYHMALKRGTVTVASDSAHARGPPWSADLPFG